jgi:hypothetical protein
MMPLPFQVRWTERAKIKGIKIPEEGEGVGLLEMGLGCTLPE